MTHPARRGFLMLICCAPLLLVQERATGQHLPHAMTEIERLQYHHYRPPRLPAATMAPPPFQVRAMAEWEELQAVVIAWSNYPTVPYEIVRHAQQECTVVIVALDSTEVIEALTAAGVPLTNVRFVITDYNSEWCRDYGPFSVYAGGADSLQFIDWIYNRPRPQDDTVSLALSRSLGVPLYAADQSPDSLVGTGGNFMTDGHGTGFSSDLIFDENPDKTDGQIDSILSSYMGIRRFIAMPDLPFDGIHHIDMHMKLLDEETLLVGEYPEDQGDGPWIEANLNALTSSTLSCFNRPYRVVRIPMPPGPDGTFPPASDYYTYTNSVILNRSVLVPVYGLPQDSIALAIYRNAMPGYTIVGILSNELIPNGGAIHCITKEIGVGEPVWISHAPEYLRDSTDHALRLSAQVRSRSGVQGVTCFWTSDTSRGFTALPMVATGDSFSAELSPLPRGTTVRYYLEARSVSGRTVKRPLTAPSGYYTVATPPGTPEFPAQLLPHDGATGQPVPCTFSWTGVAGVARYHLQVASDSLFTSGLVVNDSTVADSMVSVSKLSGGSRYFWRVGAVYIGGIEAFSSVRAFTAGSTLPEPVVLIAPTNGSFLMQDSVRFLWHPSHPLIERYALEIGIDSLFVFRVTDSTLTDTARVTTGLQENVRYYWRVRAKNPTGWGAYSPTWTFGWYLDAVAGASELPRKFALHQNYPNPFNSSTLIGFEVPDVGSQASVVSSQWSEASWITLGIYDILGREVAVLVDQKKAPGRYEARWDAGKCPSGVYVYRMTAGAFVQTRKMILLR